MAITQCRECKKEVSTGAKECPHCGIPHPGVSPVVGAVVGVAILLLIGTVIVMWAQDDDDLQPVASVPDEQPAERRISVTIPDDQRLFMEEVIRARQAYASATNELQRSSVRSERDQRLREIVPGGTFEGWYGHLTAMGTTGDGHAWITVTVPGRSLTLKTWNNAISDSTHRTLITHGSSLYTVLSTLHEGQVIRMSGRLIREASVTEAGSVTDPEFIARFSSIEVVE